MFYLIFISFLVGTIVLWIISTQRTIVILDENINNAISQIGLQLASQWDGVFALTEMTKKVASQDIENLLETVKGRRGITKDSSAEDINNQENMILAAMGQMMVIAEKYPNLNTDKEFAKNIMLVNQYEHMVRTSYLIYNDSVTKLNRGIRMFPVSLIAGILGFSKRRYLEEVAEKVMISST